MRTYAYLQLIALVVLAACASHHGGANASSPAPSPSPLLSCEVREMVVDGADVTVTANADSTVASMVVTSAPNAAVRAQALADAQHLFGPVQPDTRYKAGLTKWGVPQLTDDCGHIVQPTPSSSPVPAPAST